MPQKEILDLNGLLENPNAYKKMTPVDAIASIKNIKNDILDKKESDAGQITKFVVLLKKISNDQTISSKVRDEAKLAYETIERSETRLKVPVRTNAEEINIHADSATVATGIFRDLNNPEYRQYARYVTTKEGGEELIGDPVFWSETQNYTSDEAEAKKLDTDLFTAAHYPDSKKEEREKACADAAKILGKSEALTAEIGKDGVDAVTKKLKEEGYEAFKEEYKKQLEKNGKDPDSGTFNAYLGNVENSGIMETTTRKTKRIWHLGLGIDLEFKAGSEKLFEWGDPTVNPPPFQIVPLGVTLYFQRVLQQWVEETEKIDFSKKGAKTTSQKSGVSDTTEWYQMAGGELRGAFLFKNMGVIGKLVITGDEQSMRFDFVWKEPEGGVNYLKLLPNHILEFKGFKMSRSTPAEGIESQYNLEANFGGETVLIAKWLKLEEETALKLINGQDFGGDMTVKMKFDPGAGFQLMLFGLVDYNNLEKMLRYGGGVGANIPITEGFEIGVDAQYTQFMDFNPAKKKLFGGKEQDDVQLNMLLTFRF